MGWATIATETDVVNSGPAPGVTPLCLVGRLLDGKLLSIENFNGEHFPCQGSVVCVFVLLWSTRVLMLILTMMYILINI